MRWKGCGNILGEIPCCTVIHGKAEEVLSSIEPSQEIVIVTDPPYGIKHKRGSATNRGKGVTLGNVKIINDHKLFDASHLLKFRVLTWGACWYAHSIPQGKGRWLVWDKKEHGGSGDFSDAEIAWCSEKGSTQTFHHMWLGVQRRSEVGQRRMHPTQKPIVLMRWCIELFKSPKPQIIIDPYCGSGPTLLAAAQLGLHFVGVDLDKNHVNTALNRLRLLYVESRNI